MVQSQRKFWLLRGLFQRMFMFTPIFVDIGPLHQFLWFRNLKGTFKHVIFVSYFKTAYLGQFWVEFFVENFLVLSLLRIFLIWCKQKMLNKHIEKRKTKFNLTRIFRFLKYTFAFLCVRIEWLNKLPIPFKCCRARIPS